MADRRDLNVHTIRLEADVEIIKKALETMSDSVAESAKSQKELNGKLSELIVEMREHGIHNEYLTKQVARTEEKLDTFIQETKPHLERLKARNEFYDNFIKGISSNWGRLASLAILLAILYFFGITPENIINALKK
jgi:septal ring factor EnvC (AmiA/AmiB activator)